MRSLGTVLAVALGFAVLAGGVRAFAQDSTPATDGSPLLLTLMEHSASETITDLGAPGFSAGDLIVWGPNPLYDAANAVDTGAVTQGSCQVLNAAGDGHCIETIVFPDGSTLAIQGVQLGNGAQSTTTIVGGSGRYLHAGGTLVVEASADRLLWTKTLKIWTP
jgi:hypothetical protein